MKRMLTIYFSLLFLLGTFLLIEETQAGQSTWERAKAEGKLTIVMASGYPPFSFIGEDGKQTGFDTELARAFANHHGLKLDIKLVQFEGVIPALIGKKSDMIVSIWATSERKKAVDFSEVYWRSGMTFASLTNKPLIGSMEEAAGKTIGVQQGSWAQSVLAEGSPKAIQKAYKGGPVEMYQDLAIGRTDAVFEDRDVSKYYLRKNPGKFQYSDKLYAAGEYAWAIRKEDKDLLEAANVFILKAKTDGTIERIAKEYGLVGAQ